MGRKRKVPIVENEEKENEDEPMGNTAVSNNSTMMHGPMYTIMSNVQLNETFHKRYIKEMKQLYIKMDHDAFMFTMIKMIKAAMEADEHNEYAHTTLLFCAKFLSSYDGEETHPILVDMCKWLLTTISNNPHIRFRLCEFVNMILNALGQEAALDDAICDNIMEYMLERLRDVSTSVRVQATLAMQRLQVPDNPDDAVLRAYQFHLCSDPSPRVRQAVITCMGRNYHTIPYILDRLWDIDEKVRRHTYLHMSSYPVRSYKVSQRLMLLEQGLNDRSETVRKVVTSIMLKQWIESYQKNLIALISALKLDSNKAEITRFQKIAKQTLNSVFSTQAKEDLVMCLPLEEEDSTTFHRCVSHEKLTLEVAFYWQCLTEYLQSEMAEELDAILPELSTFCAYIEKFCESQRSEMDKFEQMEFQYMLRSLMEILHTYDLGDETGRGNLQKLLAHLLKTYTLDEKVIEMAVRCAENLMPDQHLRLQFFAEIIRDICDLHPKKNDVVYYCNLINDLLSKNSSDGDFCLRLSALKVKLMDLDEQETNYLRSKDYVQAQEIAAEKSAALEQHMHVFEKNSDGQLQINKAITNEVILKSLQIIFHMVVSPKVNSLNPSIFKLYNDFICRHIASPQINIRDWALRCGTAYSMLYETLAKDVFDELYSQFYKNHNIRIWETAITCIFELLGRYGVDNFMVQDHQIKTKKSGRQLYNTLEFLDMEDDARTSITDQSVGVIYMLSHFLDTCDDVCILRCIIEGFCCLVLRGFIKSSEIMEKLLLRYFNPTTDAEINQMLGVFLESLIARKELALLPPCLLPTINTVMSASYDSALKDIRPETISRFIIDATRQKFCAENGYVHNKLAHTFLQEMVANVTNKELCKLLAKELLTLELNLQQHEQLKKEMKDMSEKLVKWDFDSKTIKNIINFRDMLDGVYNPPRRTNNENESADESKSDDDTAARESVISHDTAPPTTASNPPSPAIGSPRQTTTKRSPKKTTQRSPQAANGNPAAAADAADKTLSPSARGPTTYGRDNIIGHRYLRKSLNSSQSQTETDIGDGPSRPNKIRIEARIDSDKKAPPDPVAEPRPTNKQANSAAVRRNLRYAQRNVKASTAEPVAQEKVKTPPRIVVQQSTPRSTSPKTTEQKSPSTTPRLSPTSATTRTTMPVAESSQSPRTRQRAQQLPGTKAKGTATSQEAPKLPTRASTRHATRAAVSTAPTRTPSQSEELNSSDVIPPSPSADTTTRLNATRLRRAAAADLLEANSPTRRTRNAAATRAVNAAARTKSKPQMVDAATTTPLRNGRKRILQMATPKIDANRISPQRKQQRTDAEAETEAVTAQSSQQATREYGSPSSTKENDELLPSVGRSGRQSEGTKNSPRKSAAKPSNGDAKAVSSSPAATALKETCKSLPHAGNETFVVPKRTSASATVTTRNLARKELERNTIVTRKRRLSLYQRSSSSSSCDSNVRARAAALSLRRAVKVSSRIPVRTTATKVALRTVIVSSSSSTTTASSTEEGTTSSSSSSTANENRQMLSTKAMRGCKLPLPIRLARSTRTVNSTAAATSRAGSTQAGGNSRSMLPRRRKH